MDTIWHCADASGMDEKLTPCLKCLDRFMNISWLFSGVLIGMNAIKSYYKRLYKIKDINGKYKQLIYTTCSYLIWQKYKLRGITTTKVTQTRCNVSSNVTHRLKDFVFIVDVSSNWLTYHVCRRVRERNKICNVESGMWQNLLTTYSSFCFVALSNGNESHKCMHLIHFSSCILRCFWYEFLR
jgi:hypothetical protein